MTTRKKYDLEFKQRAVKLSHGLLREKDEISKKKIYAFIHQQTKYAKAKWAKHLKVSRSGHYHWVNVHEARTQKANQRAAKVERIFQNG